MKGITIFTGFLFLSLVAYSQSVNWKLLVQNGYSIKYPENWKLEDNSSGYYKSDFLIKSPSDREGDVFNENVNLFIEEQKKPVTLDKYHTDYVSRLTTRSNRATIIENQKLRNHNGEYWKIAFETMHDIHKMVFEQYLWMIDNKLYKLSFVAQVDKFREYKILGETSLNSFTIKQ